MDVFSGKRAKDGLVVPRRGTRNTADNRDEDVRLCSRPGCSSWLNHSKSSQVGITEKQRPLRPNFNSSNGKDVVGSSCRTSPVLTNVRKAREESRTKKSSQVGNAQSEGSSLDGVSEVTEQVQSMSEYQLRSNSATRDTRSSKARSKKAGCSSGTSSSVLCKINSHKSGSYNQHNPIHSSISSPSKAIDSEKRSCSSGAGHGLRNLKCKSISDVLPHSCSTESRFSRRDIVKRRNTEGESSSSAKGKKLMEAPPKGGHVARPTHGISISESRGNRNSDYIVNNHAESVQTGRSMNVNSRFRGTIHDSSQTESSGLVQNLHRPGTPNLNLWSSSQVLDGSSSDSSSYSYPGNEIDDLPSLVPFTYVELGMNRLVNQQALQRYNIEGVAQALQALGRTEREYEQLLALETDLLLSSLNFYDQHRDMRLDIDNMSYEELLALGERMGTVSTALPEEAVSKCLRRINYQGMHTEVGGVGGDGDGDEDEIKCSICQEEYVVGDEIGKLECEHGYHMECVQQWLRIKNWCPICKTSAASSAADLTTRPS